MQLTDSIKAFFAHVTMEFAIRSGWDFQGDLVDFYRDNNIDLSVSYASLASGEDISENDIFQASLGVVTPSFAKFWLAITLKDDAPEDGVVMQSMHSGSSDYLFISDVKEIQEIAKNVVA